VVVFWVGTAAATIMNMKNKKDKEVYDFLTEDQPAKVSAVRKANAIVPGAKVRQTLVLHDGKPLLKKQISLYKEDLEDMLITIMSNPEKIDEEKLMAQASFTERMIYSLAMKAADGDLEAIKYIFDRVLGRPTTKNESKSISGTYEDFLKLLEKKEQEDF
jgi:hypothetical protein